jgi:hypothetical protein
MLTVRVDAGTRERHREIAEGVAEAARQHPVLANCDLLVAIGAGDPTLIRASDPSHRIIVPLAWARQADPIMSAQLLHASGIVLLDPAEAAHLPIQASESIVVVAEPGAGARTPFLARASVMETLEAHTAILDHPALASAVSARNATVTQPAIDAANVVNAIAEIAILLGVPVPPARPLGRSPRI